MLGLLLTGVLNDLFERRVSAVVRETRRQSRAVPASMQPSTLAEAGRIRSYCDQKQITTPGEDRRCSFNSTLPGAAGEDNVEVIVEDKERRPSLKRKKTSLSEQVREII